MAIPLATIPALQAEGITTVADLIDFDEDAISRIASNLRNPGGRVPNPDGPGGATIPRPPYTFGAKSQLRLGWACEILRYYDTVSREPTAANMKWSTVVKDFSIQWKALKERADSKTEVDTPKISRALPILKWTEAFEDFLTQVIGSRTIPLAYVIRENPVVDPVAPPLLPNKPHSEVHGSVEAELVARAGHDHASFREDNARLYYLLEEATRTTPYAASLKPYQRARDGRGAYFSILSQYAGRDKWDSELKKHEKFMHNTVWKGQSTFSLERFIAQHRNAYVTMQQCSQHVTYQLPNEYTRVGYVIDNIQCSDAKLQAAIAQVETGKDDPNSLRHHFEECAAFLIPFDPVKEKRLAGGKRRNVSISDVDGVAVASPSFYSSEWSTQVAAAHIAAFGEKPGIGKSGVHFRYHTKAEYKKLTPDQRKELHEYRLANADKIAATKSKFQSLMSKKGGGTKSTEKKKKDVSQVVAKEVTKQLKAAQDSVDEEELLHNYIMSVVNSATSPPPSKKVRIADPPKSSFKPTSPPATANALQALLSRVKNPPTSS